MKSEILKLLSRNAKYTLAQLAKMTGMTEAEVSDEITKLENQGLIRGYKTVIDWEKLENAPVSAIVELNVVPKADLGFEEIAEKVSSFEQVESVL